MSATSTGVLTVGFTKYNVSVAPLPNNGNGTWNPTTTGTLVMTGARAGTYNNVPVMFQNGRVYARTQNLAFAVEGTGNPSLITSAGNAASSATKLEILAAGVLLAATAAGGALLYFFRPKGRRGGNQKKWL